MANQSQNVDSILCQAVEISSPDQRAAYLDEACGGDAELRAEVEKLVNAHFQAGSFLGRPVAGERPTEVLNALTDRDGPPDPVPDEISLDFLKPCDVPGRVGMLGPYEVMEVIGKGGMGVVLRAHDPKLNRVVAVKVLAPEFAANPPARKRFLREAQAAAAVSHPHVVSIHAVDESENTPYLVMECIDGQSLQEKIDRVGHLKLKEILRIGSQIAAGLAAAHRQGLIHRDVKPGNILLENGVERVKITDFGLARAVDDVGITRTGDIAGTPLFMSPEQAQGKPLDQRSDLFSLGCVLYAMCTGRSPFRAETAIAVLRRVCDDTPRPIREVNPDIPDWLVAIVDRCLAKNPDERFQSASEVGELLSNHLAHVQDPTTVPPPKLTRTATQRNGKPLRRRGLLVTATLLLLLFGVLGLTEATGVTRLAATVIRIATGEGTLVIEVDDPTVQVSIDGEDVSIRGAGVEELWLRPGEYQLRAMKDGKPIKTELVTISRGGREVVKVTMELPAVSVAKSPWMTPGAPDPAIAPFDAQQARTHQEEWAKHLGVPVEYTNSIGMKFRLIPPGEFMMGSPEAERQSALEEAKAAKASQRDIDQIPTESPQHQVRITEPFYLGVYEVTQEEYERLTGTNPSSFSHTGTERNKVLGLDTSRFPVERVSWDDAVEFCRWLSATPDEKSAGRVCRLPTEAEWEYACRAGTTTPFHFGSQLNGREANCNGEHPYGSEKKGPYLRRTTTVGSYPPNAFGLYDMHGNVWESCQDWRAGPYYNYSPSEDPAGPATGSRRVTRGGSSIFYASICRSASRRGIMPGNRFGDCGFRVVCDIPYTPDGKIITRGFAPPGPPAKLQLPPDAPPPAVAPFDTAQAEKHQEEWAKYLGMPVERDIDLPGDEKLTMVLIPPGEFMMGSTDQEQARFLEGAKAAKDLFAIRRIPQEGPRHPVRITRPFYLGKYEVTRAQWEAVMGHDPSKFKDTPSHPVEQVSWGDIQPFLGKLNVAGTLRVPSGKSALSNERLQFELPTEAQWEYASRAGTTTTWPSGDSEESLQESCWFSENSGGKTHPVGQLKASAWGLCDMQGNVWEWCENWHGADYYRKSPMNDPSGPPTGSIHVFRGGSWNNSAMRCRPAWRNYSPGHRGDYLGLRLALILAGE